ncbi:MAG: tetratricopeptide repeat protein [Planctomycetes bacterium]|nr:tetratricopeptide repeat protein [Planctomycetota bacterium]
MSSTPPIATPIDASRSTRQRRTRGPQWLGVIVLLTVTWLAYIPALRAGYVWDDAGFLWKNPRIRSGDGPWDFWKLWGEKRPPDYFPLTSSMLWAEWHYLWGDSPTGYHAVNVALHTVSALMIWGVLRRLGVSGIGAWLGAMFFALHPVNVESVAWITERKNTLSLPLFLGAVACWLGYEDAVDRDARAWRWYALSVTLFVLSLLAKTAGVLLPVVLLVLAWLKRGRIGWRDVWRIVPFFRAAIVLGLITVWYQRTYSIKTAVVRDDSMWSRAALAGRAVWFYLGKVFWPVGLSSIYPRWSAAQTGDIAAWVPLASLVTMATALWRLRRRAWARAVLAASVIYVAMLLPTLGFVDVYFMVFSLVADHWQYFAIPAPLALVAWLAGRFWRGVVGKIIVACIAGFTLAICGMLTWDQGGTYHDMETHWHATILRNDGAWVAYNNLGELLLKQGHAEQAVDCFVRSIRANRNNHEAYNDMGLAFMAMNQRDAALAWYQRALQLAPEDPKVWSNIGSTLADLGRYGEALPYLESAVRLGPTVADVRFNLGYVLAKLGHPDRAAEQYRETIALVPDDAMAHNSLGLALRELHRLDEAIVQFREAKRLAPRDPEVAKNLSEAEAESARQKGKDASP